jgi:hypothetical protein
MGDYNQAMSNGRSTTDATRICHNALLSSIPQLCKMDVLEDWAAAHKFQLPARRSNGRISGRRSRMKSSTSTDLLTRSRSSSWTPSPRHSRPRWPY